MAAEQLSVELVAEFVGRDAFEALKREVAQIKGAMSGLGEVQDRVRKQTDQVAGSIRQQRQAFAQTGMQINQFAGQVAAGTPVMTAFVQQIGDVAYVMGQAGNAGGKLATFLQGPYAAAILVAISVLGPFIAKMFDAKKATEDLKKAEELKVETSKILRDAQLRYNESVADTPAKQRQAIVAILDAAKADTALANKAVENTITRVRAIQLEMKAIQERTNLQVRASGMSPTAGAAAAGFVLGAMQKEANLKSKQIDLEVELQNLRKKAAIEQSSMMDVQARLINFDKNQRETAARASEKAFEKAQKAAEKLAERQKEIAQEVSVMNIKGAQDFANSMKKLGDDSGREIQRTAMDSIQSSIQGMSSQFEEMKKAVDDVVYAGSDAIKSLSETMGQTFSEGIKGMITGANNFKDVMSNVIGAVIDELFKLFVVQQLVGFISSGISSLTGIPLKPKAIGGPVQAGSSYMVGERGPELFVPSQSGSIVPNNALGGGINISVDARGSADPAAVRQQVEIGIMQAAPYIIAAAQNKTLKTAGRTRLPGTIG